MADKRVKAGTGGRRMETQIGEAAGKVWHALHANGPMTRAQLGKVTGLPADLLNQAIGWLAREGKLVLERGKAGQTIGLKG